MRWHLYCRVVDNLGDIGVAWRLAADLASRGEDVRLAVDDAGALAWMAPGGDRRVEVCRWADVPTSSPDVVVELFGGGLPEAAANAVADAAEKAGDKAGDKARADAEPAPVVVNVEHLSAESYVERSHGLPSPRRTARGAPYTTWYVYPGFTAATGGLIREPGLDAARAAFEPVAWLGTLGIAARADERRVALFCYDGSPVEALVGALRSRPTLLLAAPGAAAAQVRAALGPTMAVDALRAVVLPALPQLDFDRLLWACDLNLVRGEDSPVRATWAGAPFVWQLYRQADGAHGIKLDAFLDRFLAGAPAPLAERVRSLFAAWNGGGSSLDPALLEPALLAAWATRCRAWRAGLATRVDLVTGLIGFVESKR